MREAFPFARFAQDVFKNFKTRGYTNIQHDWNELRRSAHIVFNSNEAIAIEGEYQEATFVEKACDYVANWLKPDQQQMAA